MGGVGVSGAPAQLAILVVDDERRCLEANLSACRLLGLPRRAVIGRTFDDFLAPGMRARLDHVWRAFREGGGHAGPFELSSRAAGAEEVHISVTANVLPRRHLLILSGAGAQIEEPQARQEPARKGEPEIEVSFDIDSNGIVNVSARDLATGREQSITVNTTGTLSEDEMRQIMAENADGEVPDHG